MLGTGKPSSVSLVGFQSASNLLKTSTGVTTTSTTTISSTSVKSSLNCVGCPPLTDQCDKKFNDDSKFSAVNHKLPSSMLSRQFYPIAESRSSSLSYYEASQGRMGHNSVGDSKECPLVIDDSNSSIEASHDHIEVSHDPSEALHDHIEASHDTHMSSSNEHSTKALHNIHMSYSNKQDKQKVANLVVCILNPYLKKGRIASKVWLLEIQMYTFMTLCVM